MARTSIFTTIHTEGALLPPDLLQRIADGDNIDGLTPESYHLYPGEKINEVTNFVWNRLQGAWQAFRTAQGQLPDDNIGTSLTREKWLLPLFDSLGYGRLQTAPAVEIDGRSYPISHRWNDHVPIHLLSYSVDLDKRTQGVAGATTASPHSLLQVFLNRSEEHLWGFVSNGYKLRILRDNASLTRQAYVEFDLEAMMDGEVYSDFVLLWLLCHQSRVEDPREPWLEIWMRTAEEQGTRALEQLRVGVEEAITALGLGFIEHPSNHELRDSLQSGDLDAQEYYRQLLRIVYRLLFLFVAEDRDLLLDRHAPAEARDCYVQFYSTDRLRRMAAPFKGTRHHDLFEGLRLVMRLLSGDSNGAGAGLGLVPLGSFLFSDAAVRDIIDCRINNTHFLDAIRALSLVYDERPRVYRSVDYKNLGSEELGSVYESLLELHPQINIPGRRFALATAGGNERKTTGSYYTPTSLVNALLDSALNPVLEEATRQGEAAILDLKICDPACGSGHFLIAAANRIAKQLAFVRTGEEEPPPAEIQQAKRLVIGHCIYGVDINPMAVELCKVNLWMEALEPGKPLSFLDHRVLVGNSLLGTTPRLMAEGIPDDAFNPIEGDDKKVASEYKKQNRDARKEREKLATGQDDFFHLMQPPADYGLLADAMHELDAAPDDTLARVREKEAYYRQIADNPEYIKARLLADAWCAAFVWEKRSDAMPPMTDLLYRRMEENPLADNLREIRETVVSLADRYGFFHWHVAFPDVFEVPEDVSAAENEQTGWNGGFDCVLGNPPWERIKIQEKEWFAERAPEIAEAPSAAVRRRMIEELKENDEFLFAAFLADKRRAEGESHFVRVSERFPLCGRGDINTYAIFAETSRAIINGLGRVGMIVPSGIATDDTTKFFFQDLIEMHSLASLYDFENKEGLFPAVHREQRFCLLTLTGSETPTAQARFVFFAHNVSHINDVERRFTLTAEEIIAINPNTRTMATFRTSHDAEVSKWIYRHTPILILEEELGETSDWNVKLIATFHMTNASHLFETKDELLSSGYSLEGNRFKRGDKLYLPLYEGKLTQMFDHRHTTFDGVPIDEARKGNSRDSLESELLSPDYVSIPRYWVSERDFQEAISNFNHNGFWLTFHDIANPNNERTLITAVCPFIPLNNKLPAIIPQGWGGQHVSCLQSNLNSYVVDFVTRLKMGGRSINFYILKQFPVIPPHTYTEPLLDFIMPRVLELTYTAWDLQVFAQDVGWDGQPFVWDEERRFLMRCELDALYFHLYQISLHDVDYIMETFPIVKRKDIARTENEEEGIEGEYVTKRVILEMYDQMAALPTMDVPAPKDPDATYQVPDVSQWQTWLDPEPASPRVAHGYGRE